MLNQGIKMMLDNFIYGFHHRFCNLCNSLNQVMMCDLQSFDSAVYSLRESIMDISGFMVRGVPINVFDRKTNVRFSLNKCLHKLALAFSRSEEVCCIMCFKKFL